MNQQLTGRQRGLYERALTGDAVAFWELIEPFERTVYAVALSATRGTEEAEDVAHDAFVRAFSTLGNLRSADKLGSWLCSMTRNIAHERFRKQIRRDRLAEHIPRQPVISVPDMLAQEEELAQMEDAMAELPEAHRTVLALRYMNNMSCREIAETLEIGLEAAKSRLFEARKALRARMLAAEKRIGHPPAQRRGVQTLSPQGAEQKAVEQ